MFFLFYFLLRIRIYDFHVWIQCVLILMVGVHWSNLRPRIYFIFRIIFQYEVWKIKTGVEDVKKWSKCVVYIWMEIEVYISFLTV